MSQARRNNLTRSRAGEVVGRQILLYIGLRAAPYIRLARGQHKAARAQQLQYLDHPRIGRHKQVARAFHHQQVGTHDAPFVDLRRPPRRRACRRASVACQHQFADPLLDLRQMAVAECLGHQQCHAEHEFAFGEVLGRPLMRRMRRGMGDFRRWG